MPSQTHMVEKQFTTEKSNFGGPHNDWKLLMPFENHILNKPENLKVTVKTVTLHSNSLRNFIHVINSSKLNSAINEKN